MKIIPYEPQYKQHFIDLNMSWINKYFQPERDDYKTMNTVDEIIHDGGMIFFALDQDVVIATCMVKPTEKENHWEISKLATDPAHQGKGAGRAIFKTSMDYAIENGATKLILVSNTMLSPALSIYRKIGFVEVPLSPENSVYERADIQLEYTVK